MTTMRLSLSALVVLAVATLAPIALAQDGAGTIEGMVLDQTGMPVKGVKVIARSDTQIGGPRVMYSNDQGFFRFVALQPGKFEVTASAPKMKGVVMKDIQVDITHPAEVNLVMEVETSIEEVKVIERPPVINTTTATIKEAFDLDFVEAMPLNSRDQPHNQLIGSVAGALGRSVRGGSDSQLLFTQDGFDMRGQQPTMKTSAAYEILTAGHGGDSPMASGAAINQVTRSGSNRFEFEFNATAESSALRFFLDPGESEASNYTYVLNPMVSGPIIKDRLWFFFNTEFFILRTDRSYDPGGIFPPRAPYTKLIPKGTIKLTWQVAPRHTLSSLTNFDSAHEYNMDDDLGTDPEAQHRRIARRLFTGLIWDGLLSDSVMVRSQAGITYHGEHTFPEMCVDSPGTCDHISPIVQTVGRRQQWINADSHTRGDTIDFQMQNRLEWFLDTKRTGSHAVRLASNFFTESDTGYTSTPGDAVVEWNGIVPGRRTVYYANDPRRDEARRGWYISGVAWRRHTATLRDQWRPTRHLTITPAITHVWGTAANFLGDSPINSMAFAPNLSAAWDATHDGRTVVRGSFSNYVDVEVEALARHTMGSRVSQRCEWNPDEAAKYERPDDPRAFNRNCTYSGGSSKNTFGRPCGPTGIDLNGAPCVEALTIPRTYEFAMGAERELVQGVALGLDGIYRRFNNQYDTRETNRIWNTSGSALVGFKNGRSETISDRATPDYNNRTYMGLTLALRKREGRLKAQTSYTISSLRGASSAYGDNPGQDLFLYGYLDNDHRHQIKAMAQYQVMRWMSVGARWEFRSGLPYDKKFRNDVTNGFSDYRAGLGVNPGTNVNDPGDDRAARLPDLTSVNVQLRFNLLPILRQRLDFYVDVLNVLASRTTTGVTENDGPNYGLPSGRSGPFRIRLGMNYRY
jgi:hypothetical protein